FRVSLANIIYFTVVNLTLIDLPGLTKVAVALGRCSQTHLYRLYRFMVLEGRSYRLQHPWVGIVNRSQADINKNVDMIAARRKEQEYFATSPDYGHLAHKMGSEYLAKLLSQVHFVLKDLVRKSIGETEELKRFPTLQADISAAANEALERFRDDSRKTVLRLVDMETSYLTVEFFRKLSHEPEKGSNPTSTPATDRYGDNHLRKIGM
ncbi:hypothetical protein B296_00045664, partial [Ensete ventricosum]